MDGPPVPAGSIPFLVLPDQVLLEGDEEDNQRSRPGKGRFHVPGLEFRTREIEEVGFGI